MECDPFTTSSNRCRVCLDHTENTVCLLDVSNTKREVVSYLHILSSICKLESENGPQEICSNCAQDAEISYDFKVLCEQSDRIFKNENNLCIINDRKVITESGKAPCNIDEHDYFDTDDVQSEMIDVKDENIDSTTQHSFNDVKPNEVDIKNLIKIHPDKNKVEDQKQSCNNNNDSSDSSKHEVNSVKITETKDSTCPLCGKGFSRKRYVKQHMLRCSKKLQNLNIVKPEINLDSICPICKRIFSRKRYIKYHILKCSKKHEESETNTLEHNKCVTLPNLKDEIITSCENYNETFAERSSYDAHINSKTCSSEKYPEKCQFCNYKPVSSIDYLTHKKTEHLQRKNLCIYCDYRFMHTGNYKKHLASKHSDKKFYCKHCNCPLYTVRRYSQHMKNMHPNEKLVCHLCNFTTDTSGILYKHYQDDHSDHFYAHQCNLCDFKTNCIPTLGRHKERAHDDKKTIQCETCDKKFFTLRLKQIHAKAQHGQQQTAVICEVCGKHLKNETTLRIHMLIHEGQGKFKCKLCPKTFHTSACLYSHNFSHSEERKHKCKDCEKFFKTTAKLNMHIKRVHLKIKPVSCNVCGRKFECRSQMLLHAVIHTGIKKYECMECGKMFSAKKNLVQHSVVHTGERKHMCEVCGKGFTQAHVLRSHLKIHSV